MRNSYRKAMSPCFGTKEFSEVSRICRNCQHIKQCRRVRNKKRGN